MWVALSLVMGGLAVGSNGSGPTGFHPVMEEGNKSSRSVADKSHLNTRLRKLESETLKCVWEESTLVEHLAASFN